LSYPHPAEKGTPLGDNLYELRRTHSHSVEKKGEAVLTQTLKRRIKQKLGTEKPTVWVGKEGTTIQIVNEISKQLDKREIVKAKILKSALQNEEAKNIAAKIAQQTESQLVEVRGHTFLLYKRKKKKPL
jgi:RNA-binding protein